MSKGIDIHIDSLKSEFTSLLWTSANNLFYGRVYRNERFTDFQSKISPEIYTSANDYIEVLLNDNYDAQCFFDVQPNIEYVDTVSKAKVRICFMIDLPKVYPSLTRTEATEQVQLDVVELINLSEFKTTQIVTGFAGFTDYDWGEQPRQDMHPYYLFRVDTEIEYTKC